MKEGELILVRVTHLSRTDCLIKLLHKIFLLNLKVLHSVTSGLRLV